MDGELTLRHPRDLRTPDPSLPMYDVSRTMPLAAQSPPTATRPLAPLGNQTSIGGATTNDTAKYATYTRDSWSGLDYAMNRFYKNEWGRFTSPDPYMGSVNGMIPSSWNRYTYVQSDPVNANDPSGLCDVFLAGITMEPTLSPNGINQFVSDTGMIDAYPYSNGPDKSIGGIGSGILDMLGLPAGDVAAIAVIAIMIAAEDPGPINIFAFSGGAAAFRAALLWLPEDVVRRVNDVTYMSPGGHGPLPSGSGRTTLVTSTDDVLDTLIGGSPSADTIYIVNTNCAHDANCQFDEASANLKALTSTPCTQRQQLTRSGSSSSPGYGPGLAALGYEAVYSSHRDPFMIMWSYALFNYLFSQRVASVSSTIIFDLTNTPPPTSISGQ